MILEQALLVLLIACACVPAVLGCLYSAGNALSFDPLLQDEIALAQLRRTLSMSYDYQINGNEVSFVYRLEEARLRLVNGNLIIQPGTQIFLTAVDSASFSLSGDVLILHYTREGNLYERALVSIT